MAIPDQTSDDSWRRVKAFATRSKPASNHPAGEDMQENNMDLVLILKRQSLESALTRAVSVTRRATRRGAPITEQLDNWFTAELCALHDVSDEQIEDKAWLYGMLELLQRLEHACAHSAGGQMGLLVWALVLDFRASMEFGRIISNADFPPSQDNWRISALLGRNVCPEPLCALSPMIDPFLDSPLRCIALLRSSSGPNRLRRLPQGPRFLGRSCTAAAGHGTETLDSTEGKITKLHGRS